MARFLGVSQPLVSQWHTGARKVPAGKCIEIEKLTHGIVRCEDLRPDVDWAYLRKANKVAA